MWSEKSSQPCELVSHVIFDLDGTLIDTETRFAKAMEDFLKEYNIPFTPNMEKDLLGVNTENLYRILKDKYNFPADYEEFIRRIDRWSKIYLKEVKFLPGVSKLVKYFVGHCIPLAIATNSSRENVRFQTRNHKQFYKLFHHITTVDEVQNPKPSPDIYIACIRRFWEKPEPQNVLVFEDSLAGAKAANSAGMRVVLVSKQVITEEEENRLVTKRLQTLQEFDVNEFIFQSKACRKIVQWYTNVEPVHWRAQAEVLQRIVVCDFVECGVSSSCWECSQNSVKYCWRQLCPAKCYFRRCGRGKEVV